jgi:tetratricopeptide (TPR) repeat protein
LPERYFSTLVHVYERAGELEAAVAIVDSRLTGTTGDVILLPFKAKLLHDAGRFEDAIATLNVGIALDSGRESLWHNKGLALDNLKRREEARVCYKKAIECDPGCPTVHYHYGVLLYEAGDFSTALGEFDKASQIRPSDPDFLLWKARVLDKTGRRGEAKQILDELIARDEFNADAWFALGRLAEDDAEALTLFERAIRVQPKHGGALCSSAACLSNLGKHDEALEAFHGMSDFCPEYETCRTLLANICTTLSKLDRSDEVLATCDELLAMDPNDVIGLGIKAVTLTQCRKFVEAEPAYAKALEVSPADASLWYNQACMYALLHKVERAIRSLRKATSLDDSFRKSMQNDPDFDVIRTEEEFRAAFPE